MKLKSALLYSTALAAVVGLECSALAETARNESFGPADKPYGYRIVNFGGDPKSVALVFTNTAYSTSLPMEYVLPASVSSLRYLVVGGGGSGGKAAEGNGAGGGGAGAFFNAGGNVGSDDRHLEVCVGAGGKAQTEPRHGEKGGISMLRFGRTEVFALGGGYGGSGGAGGDGGNGGGAGCRESGAGFLLTGGEAQQGNAGGDGGYEAMLGAGGGSSGGKGADFDKNFGAGALGKHTSILGSEIFVAGGGGGSTSNDDNGNQYGGGAGKQNADAEDGSAWGAGGGGSAGATGRSGAGGDGVVVVTYTQTGTDGGGLFVIVQ